MAPRRTLALALLAATIVPAPASAWCQSLSITVASSRCDPPCLTLDDFTPDEIDDLGIVELAWRQPCVEWTLHPSGTTDMPRDAVLGVVEASFARWTAVECAGGPIPFQVTRVDVPDLECDFVDYRRGTTDTNVILFAEDWSARGYAANAFALTTTWYDTDTGEILGADLELNDQRNEWAVCPDEGCTDGRVDLEAVVVHELGHFFGLAHTPDDSSATMWACAGRGETDKRSLEADDIAGWCTIYEGSLAETCPPPPEGQRRLTCSFVGESCDPDEPSSCNSGRCEDLGSGPVCTIPCDEDDPVDCPEDAECLAVGPAGAPRCVRSGCGCRVAGGTSGIGPWALALALVALRRRR